MTTETSAPTDPKSTHQIPFDDNDTAADCQHEIDVQANAFAVDRLSQAFETSARRWELVVYPSMFAFIILAAYGFYLIFNLAKDVHYLAISVDSNMTVMSSNMQSISENIVRISDNVRSMSASVDSMSTDVRNLTPMLATMQTIEQSLQSMTYTTATMRDDLGVMNRSISRPMGFMNNMMPW
jgi:methyl-accepting chemotaxis protein